MPQTEASLHAKLKAVLDSGEEEAIKNAVSAINASYTYIRGNIEAEKQTKAARGLTLVKATSQQKKNVIIMTQPDDWEIIR